MEKAPAEGCLLVLILTLALYDLGQVSHFLFWFLIHKMREVGLITKLNLVFPLNNGICISSEIQPRTWPQKVGLLCF